MTGRHCTNKNNNHADDEISTKAYNQLLLKWLSALMKFIKL